MFETKYFDGLKERTYNEALLQIAGGAKAVGVYCAFTPQELIAAAKALPVTLCAGSEEPVGAAEQHLPKNLCPLVKSSYGYALTNTCPYFDLVDFLFADATCDGKKKMFELLNNIKPVHVLHLPQTYQTEESTLSWLKELYKMKSILEQETGNKITAAELNEQIKLFNEYRTAVKELFELNKGDNTVLFGKEICDILDVDGGIFYKLERRSKEIRESANAARERYKDLSFQSKVKNRSRILLTGCPSTNPKVINLIEQGSGMVVAMENCGGLKTVGTLVEINHDPMRALAEYYVKTACPCMTPNPRRFDIIGRIIEEYNIDGVVELTWHACHTYNVEAHSVKKYIREKFNKPYFQIETDYSEGDTEQIRIRIDAFLEILRQEGDRPKA